MDSEEVDIGTVRNLEASSWTSPHFQVDHPVVSMSPRRPGGLTSPSAPDIIEDSLSNQLQNTTAALPRVKTLPQLRQNSAATADPPALDVDNITKMRRWMLGVAVGKYWMPYHESPILTLQ